MPKMNAPTNQAERKAAIKAAAEALCLSVIPSAGYCPGKIGTEFADAIIQTLENHPDIAGEGIDIDLGHECLEMIISRTLNRLNEHYDKRNK
jgi:hypothetical protein